jgi:hypothetical protein
MIDLKSPMITSDNNQNLPEKGFPEKFIKKFNFTLKKI